MRQLPVLNYDPNWPTVFDRESNLVRELLGTQFVGVHHIGSTAIPGMMAKPVVDVLAIVKNINVIDALRESFDREGLQWRSADGRGAVAQDRRHLVRLSDDGLHQAVEIQIFPDGHREITRLLLFRDYLRRNPEAARMYLKLKVDLRKQFPFQVDLYQHGKAGFIENMLKLAFQQRFQEEF